MYQLCSTTSGTPSWKINHIHNSHCGTFSTWALWPSMLMQTPSIQQDKVCANVNCTHGKHDEVFVLVFIHRSDSYLEYWWMAAPEVGWRWMGSRYTYIYACKIHIWTNILCANIIWDLYDNRYFYTLKSDVVFRFYAFWHLHVVVSDFCVDFMKINSWMKDLPRD